MRRGFTILETMFAAAFLLIVVMGVLDILPSAALASKRADQQMTADALAQGRLEEMRAASYASLADASDEVVVSGTRYHLETVVTAPPPGLGTPSVKCITVQVTWEDPATARPGAAPRPRSLKAQLYVREGH